MKRRATAGLVLLCLAVGAALLISSGPDRDGPSGAVTARPERPVEHEPTLRGTAPETPGGLADASPRVVELTVEDAQLPPASRTVDGVVVDESGDPVADATVHMPGPDDVPAPTTRTDAEGRWRLEARTTAPWIGVLARGFLPLHLQKIDPTGESLRLVLVRGPELGLRVERADGGSLDLDTDIHLQPTAPGARPRPGPGEAWSFRETVTIPGGSREARVHLSTTGEVRVRASYRHTGWLSDPETVTAVPRGQVLTFTIRPSCRLDFRVFEASDGRPLPRGFSYSILADGKAVTGGGTTPPGGSLRLNSGVRPGRYVVRVWATGYRPRESEVLTLAAPGDVATVEVHLERDATRGDLRVSVPALATLPRRRFGGGESQAAPAFFQWRRPVALAAPWERDFGAPSEWGGLDGETRRETDTEYVVEGIPEGEVAVLVGNAASGKVALVRNVQIRGGRTDSITVHLESGVRFDPTTVVPETGTCRSFRIRHPVHGELPTWSFREGGSYSIEPGKVPPLDQVIGPYPGPEIEVEVEREDGTREKTILTAE